MNEVDSIAILDFILYNRDMITKSACHWKKIDMNISRTEEKT